MVTIREISDMPDEVWDEFFEILLDEESSVDDIADAVSQLSLTFSSLDPKHRNSMNSRLAQFDKTELENFVDTVDCLFDEDRMNEIYLIFQLIPRLPEAFMQRHFAFWNVEEFENILRLF